MADDGTEPVLIHLPADLLSWLEELVRADAANGADTTIDEIIADYVEHNKRFLETSPDELKEMYAHEYISDFVAEQEARNLADEHVDLLSAYWRITATGHAQHGDELRRLALDHGIGVPDLIARLWRRGLHVMPRTEEEKAALTRLADDAGVDQDEMSGRLLRKALAKADDV